MTERVYLAKLIGDGLSVNTAFRPAWIDLLDPPPVQIGQTIDSERYNFWIGQLDTSSAQHTILLVDNRIRYVPQALMAARLSELTQNQRDALIELYTWLGLPIDTFANTAMVKEVLFNLVGHICWHPIRQAVTA